MPPEEQIKKLEAEKAELEKKNSDLSSKVETLETTVKDKDAIIEQKNQDIIGARRKYKTLKEMSEDEKANMSEEDIKRKEEQDLIYERQEEIAKEQAETLKAERESRLNAAIDRYANGDQELATKIKANYDSFRGSDKASTVEEIGAFVTKSVALMGPDAPKPIAQAGNDQGGNAGNMGGSEKSYADTEAGKSAMKMMGLPDYSQQQGGGNQPPAANPVPPAASNPQQ